MGEKVEVKNEGEKKEAAADGGEKKAEAPTAVVLKLDLHCEGCAKKVRRSISHLQGVEKVKADYDGKKLTVTGNVDPTWLREKVESKTKKKVELLSPQPNKDGGAADKNAAEEKPETKTEEKKGDDSKKPKEAVVSTVVMKIKLHCDGCANKIKRVILKNIDGVNSVSTNLQKDTVTVTGTMDSNELASFLKEKLKRSVEIVAPKKDDGGGDKKAGDGGGGDKKEKEDGGGTGGTDAGGEKKDKQGSKSGGAEKKEGGGEKKEGESKAAAHTSQDGGADKKEGGGDGGETSKGSSGRDTKVEVNKLEHHIYNPNTYYTMPMYNQAYVHHDYGAPMYHHDGYSNPGYAMHYAPGPPPPPPTYLNPNDNMFSDENPNGCTVM